MINQRGQSGPTGKMSITMFPVSRKRKKIKQDSSIQLMEEDSKVTAL